MHRYAAQQHERWKPDALNDDGPIERNGIGQPTKTAVFITGRKPAEGSKWT